MTPLKTSPAELSGIDPIEMSRRIKDGQEKARSSGQHIGRKKTRNSELIRALLKSGMSYREIAKITGTSRTSVHNEKNQEQKEQVPSTEDKIRD